MATNGDKPGGFRVKLRSDTLDFAGTDLEGARVEVRLDASMDVFIELAGMADVQEVEQAKDLIQRFGDELIVDWDLVEDNEEETPFPANGEGMRKMPPRIALIIIAAWTAKMQVVPVPLDPKSNDGENSEELLIEGLASQSHSLVPSSELDL